jgi:Bacterial membrane protein YfhO
VAALLRRPDRATAGFLAIGGVGALAAFGSPFYRVLYTAVPGLSRLRGVNRFVFLIDVALAGLAAVGLDRLLRADARQRRAFLVGGGIALALMIVSVTAVALQPVSWSYLVPRVLFAALLVVGGTGVFMWLRRNGARRLIAGVGVVLLVAIDLWVFGFRYHPFQRARPIYDETPLVQRLLASSRTRPRLARLFSYWIPVNAALTHRLYDVQGYDNFIPTRYVELVGLMENQIANARRFNVIYNFTDPLAFFSPIADLLGIRFVLAPNDQVALGTVRFKDEVSIFTRPFPIGPAYLVHCWAVVPSTSTLARVRTMDRSELRSIAIVDKATVHSPPIRNSSCSPGAPVTIKRYEPEAVTVTAGSDRPSLLVLTDTWDEGWEATIDGRQAPVARVDHSLRGVFLGPGRHTVELRYRPDWVGRGLLGTGASLIVLAAFGFGMRLRHRSAGSPGGSEPERDRSPAERVDHSSEGAGSQGHA